jgi:hypothetical protein
MSVEPNSDATTRVNEALCALPMCRDNDPRCLSCVTGGDALQASGAVLTTHRATKLLAHYFTFDRGPIL